MTRVNLIPPKDLYDQHLFAEYRELQHIPKSLQRSLKKSKGFCYSEIPTKFTLNKGHVKFFYNKGNYLQKRFDLIKEELKARNFNIQDKIFEIDLFPEELRNDWEPSFEDLELIKQRIQARVNEKPDWYRKTPKKELK